MSWFLLLSAAVWSATADPCAPAADSSRLALAGGSLTEIVYFLGAQDRIVATDTTSTYPPEAQSFPSVGYVRGLSTEGILSLTPTLILGEDDMGPPEVIAQLRRTGVPTVRIPEAHTAEGIVTKLRCVARTLGLEGQAEALIAGQLNDSLARLQRYREQTKKRPRVVVLLGLRDGVPLAAGRNTSGHGLLQMIGADNVVAGIDGWKPLSMEALVKAQPEYIVVPKRGIHDAGGSDALLSHPALRLTPAARHKRLIAMDGMAILGFGPRTLQAAVELATHLYGQGRPTLAAEP